MAAALGQNRDAGQLAAATGNDAKAIVALAEIGLVRITAGDAVIRSSASRDREAKKAGRQGQRPSGAWGHETLFNDD